MSKTKQSDGAKAPRVSAGAKRRANNPIDTAASENVTPAPHSSQRSAPTAPEEAPASTSVEPDSVELPAWAVGLPLGHFAGDEGDLVALVEALGGPLPTALLEGDEEPPAPVGTPDHLVPTAEGAARAAGELPATMGALAAALRTREFVGLLTTLNVLPSWRTTAPQLTFLPPDQVRARPDQRRAGEGETAYRCGLTHHLFALPKSAPVPALVFRDVFDGAEAPRGALEAACGDGGDSMVTVHPALVEAGPRAVAVALVRGFLREAEDWAEGLYEVCQLASLVAEIGRALDAGEVTAEAPIPAKWPEGLFATPEQPSPAPAGTWVRKAAHYRDLGFSR